MLDEETETQRNSTYRIKLGLQSRISLFFAIGGLLVSIGLSGATLVLTRQQLVESRENSASAFALTNATRLSNQLTPDSSVEDLPSIVDADILDRILGSIDMSNCSPENSERINEEIDSILVVGKVSI